MDGWMDGWMMTANLKLEYPFMDYYNMYFSFNPSEFKQFVLLPNIPSNSPKVRDARYHFNLNIPFDSMVYY